jgi:hypothetical protein
MRRARDAVSAHKGKRDQTTGAEDADDGPNYVWPHRIGAVFGFVIVAHGHVSIANPTPRGSPVVFGKPCVQRRTPVSIADRPKAWIRDLGSRLGFVSRPLKLVCRQPPAYRFSRHPCLADARVSPAQRLATCADKNFLGPDIHSPFQGMAFQRRGILHRVCRASWRPPAAGGLVSYGGRFRLTPIRTGLRGRPKYPILGGHGPRD